MSDDAVRTSDLYQTKNIPERFDNPGNLNFILISLKNYIGWKIMGGKLINLMDAYFFKNMMINNHNYSKTPEFRMF